MNSTSLVIATGNCLPKNLAIDRAQREGGPSAKTQAPVSFLIGFNGKKNRFHNPFFSSLSHAKSRPSPPFPDTKQTRWPQDVLRHTFASFTMAEVQDAGKVAAEMGNSAGVLMRHYRELMTRDDARKYRNAMAGPTSSPSRTRRGKPD